MPRRPPKPARGRLRPFDGASTRLLGDLHRCGEGTVHLEAWARFVRNPSHRKRAQAYETGWSCCGGPYDYEDDYRYDDPMGSRELLDHIVGKLPRRSARELRLLIDALDDLY